MVLVVLFFVMIIRKLIDLGDEGYDKKEVKVSFDGKEIGDDVLFDYDEDDERYRYEM